MLAYFYQGKHVGIWQDQSNQVGWLDTTAQALGHDKSQVEVYFCEPVRSDTAYFFDDQKRLVVQAGTQTVMVDGVEREVMTWQEPVELTRFYPPVS